MRTINQKAAAIFLSILNTANLQEHGSCTTINNSSSYMPLHIAYLHDVILSNSKTALKVYAMAHYGEQNGDRMKDPEMVFAVGTKQNVRNGEIIPAIYPLSFEQSYIGYYDESVDYNDDGEIFRFYPSIQASQATFAATWLDNIKYQQQL
jgi:hypothetical protein